MQVRVPHQVVAAPQVLGDLGAVDAAAHDVLPDPPFAALVPEQARQPAQAAKRLDQAGDAAGQVLDVAGGEGEEPGLVLEVLLDQVADALLAAGPDVGDTVGAVAGTAGLHQRVLPLAGRTHHDRHVVAAAVDRAGGVAPAGPGGQDGVAEV